MPPAHRPLRHRGFLAGAVLVSVFAAASLLAPVLAPQDPHAVASGEVLSLKARDFVQAARALGGGHRAIMLRHLLPNALAPLLVAATIGVGGNMVAEAGLSFLGLGAQSPTISWGAMLADGQTF